jgi:hypothetical protein
MDRQLGQRVRTGQNLQNIRNRSDSSPTMVSPVSRPHVRGAAERWNQARKIPDKHRSTNHCRIDRGHENDQENARSIPSAWW